MVEPIGAAWFETLLSQRATVHPGAATHLQSSNFSPGPRAADTITLSHAAVRLLDQAARLQEMRDEVNKKEFA